MSEPAVDLSPLDPFRDPRHLESVVGSLVRRARAARMRQFTVAAQLRSWACPLLAVAASIALLSWIGRPGEFFATGPAMSGAVSSLEPSAVLSSWARGDAVPSTETILVVFGGTPNGR